MRDSESPLSNSAARPMHSPPLAATDASPELTAVRSPVTTRQSVNRERLVLFAKLLTIAACLYLFIVGIGAMGHALKLFGKGFSEQLLQTTASPFVGLFIGILATSLVQSSSTTTSIIVGMVAGGGISLAGAIP